MIFINPPAHVNQDIPNLGLAYAATHFNARVIDLNTCPCPEDRYLERQTDVLGISVQSRTFSESKRIAEEYKKKYPEARVKSVSGFLDIQCCYPYIDFSETLRHDAVFSDAFPFPDFELFDSCETFRKNWSSGSWGYAIITALGCPFRCTYCQSKKRGWRPRSPQNCFEELQQAKEKWGIKKFNVIDDCFNVSAKRVLEFCGLIQELDLIWGCSNGLRADIFNEDIARALCDSGCQYVNFGVESANQKVLDSISKGETVEQIEEAIAIARKYFAGIGGFFIIGLPGSNYELDLQTIEWVKRQKINAHFSYYVPFEDREAAYDKLFFGDTAEPVAETYEKEKQKELYEKTIPLRRWREKITVKQVKNRIARMFRR